VRHIRCRYNSPTGHVGLRDFFRAPVRRHRRAQGDRPTLRSIRPKRATLSTGDPRSAISRPFGQSVVHHRCSGSLGLDVERPL